MTPRILDRSEWATRLVGTDLEAVHAYLPPSAYVLVIEDGDAIVGCWAAIQHWHVEGLWVHPEHRKQGSVGRRLLIAMGRLLTQIGAPSVLTAALTDDVAVLILKAGGRRLPGTHFVLPVGGL